MAFVLGEAPERQQDNAKLFDKKRTAPVQITKSNPPDSYAQEVGYFGNNVLDIIGSDDVFPDDGL